MGIIARKTTLLVAYFLACGIWAFVAGALVSLAFPPSWRLNAWVISGVAFVVVFGIGNDSRLVRSSVKLTEKLVKKLVDKAIH